MDNPQKRKNPSRLTWKGRLTGWDREEFEKKNSELEKSFREAINHLGFDSAMNVPDYVLSEALVSLLWSIARFYRGVKSEKNTKETELIDQLDKVDQVDWDRDGAGEEKP
jgi:hypothetical protein